MPVYVDNARQPFGRMRMSHMVADTLDELHEMARRIGLKRDWFQGGASFPHYDVSDEKRRLAIQLGAIRVDRRGMVGVMRRVRSTGEK